VSQLDPTIQNIFDSFFPSLNLPVGGKPMNHIADMPTDTKDRDVRKHDYISDRMDCIAESDAEFLDVFCELFEDRRALDAMKALLAARINGKPLSSPAIALADQMHTLAYAKAFDEQQERERDRAEYQAEADHFWNQHGIDITRGRED